MSDNAILLKWSEIKALVGSLEVDVAKNSRTNAAAGVRARKGLRLLQTTAKQLVKLTLVFDKAASLDKEKA